MAGPGWTCGKHKLWILEEILLTLLDSIRSLEVKLDTSLSFEKQVPNITQTSFYHLW